MKLFQMIALGVIFLFVLNSTGYATVQTTRVITQIDEEGIAFCADPIRTVGELTEVTTVHFDKNGDPFKTHLQSSLVGTDSIVNTLNLRQKFSSETDNLTNIRTINGLFSMLQDDNGKVILRDTGTYTFLLDDLSFLDAHGKHPLLDQFIAGVFGDLMVKAYCEALGSSPLSEQKGKKGKKQ